ncbi:MAG: hypothetical protein KKC28_14700 [Verrucomicrobia bacterium]|nr:hypothetical protein [Verrucomicrobiota bacterium]
MKLHLLTMISVAILCFGHYVNAKTNDIIQTNKLNVSAERLKNARERERLAVINSIEKEYNGKKSNDLQNSLIEILAQPEYSNEAKCAAAVLIGRCKIDKGLDMLSKNISLFDGSPDPIGFETFPAKLALIRIGKPATPFMIKNLEESDNEVVRDLSAQVISAVEGSEGGRFVIEKAIEKQTDKDKRQKLEAILNTKYFIKAK